MAAVNRLQILITTIAPPPITIPMDRGDIFHFAIRGQWQELGLVRRENVPYISNVSPADGSSIEHADSISFDVTFPNGIESCVVIAKVGSLWEDVYDGSGISPLYVGSASTVGPVIHFTNIKRTPGWTSENLEFLVIAVDQYGNQNAYDPLNWIVNLPQADAPAIAPPFWTPMTTVNYGTDFSTYPDLDWGKLISGPEAVIQASARALEDSQMREDLLMWLNVEMTSADAFTLAQKIKTAILDDERVSDVDVEFEQSDNDSIYVDLTISMSDGTPAFTRILSVSELGVEVLNS